MAATRIQAISLSTLSSCATWRNASSRLKRGGEEKKIKWFSASFLLQDWKNSDTALRTNPQNTLTLLVNFQVSGTAWQNSQCHV